MVSSIIAACPSCPAVVEARSLLFEEAFWQNAMTAALPFLVSGLAVRWFVRRLDREDGHG